MNVLALAPLWLFGTALAAAPAGLVVEEVEPGYAAYLSGLKPGDVLLAWERAAAEPAYPDQAQGEVRSAFDLLLAEHEQAPRGRLTLRGSRGGQALVVRMENGDWRLVARPPLADSDLKLYERGRADPAQGLSLWAEVAARLGSEGDHATAAWLWLKAGERAAGRRDWPSAEDHFAQAAAEARATGDAYAVAAVHDARGEAFRAGSQWERALAAYAEALPAYRAFSPSSLGEPWIISRMGRVAASRGDFSAADEHYKRALALREERAPGSNDVGGNLLNLAVSAQSRGDVDAAEDYNRRALAVFEALAIEQRVASCLNNLGLLSEQRGDLTAAEDYYARVMAIDEPQRGQTSDFAGTLQNLGILARKRGNLAAAEEYLGRAMAIQERLGEDLSVANNLHNLAGVAVHRGDLAAAADLSRRAVAIRERLAPQSLELGAYLHNLAWSSEQSGDLVAAEGYLLRALALKERVAPDGIGICPTLNRLGDVARKRGDLVKAREYIERALAIAERKAPRGDEMAYSERFLGDVALAASDLSTAESHYLRALDIHRQFAPGTDREAEDCQLLAALHRRRHSGEKALEFYRCALDALDSQHRTLGGTDVGRASFTGRFAASYSEAIDLLVEMGRPQEAFAVLERYRARGFLALLAERDLVFSADVPPKLDRERRLANADYDGTLARLGHASGNEAEKLRRTLAAIRERQAVVQGRIRAASPRLAALQYPQPMDLASAQAAMDPGTVLLSYVLGEARAYVFVVGPGPGEFRVVLLHLTRPALRADAARFRELLERRSVLGRRPLQALARRLGVALLRPVADSLRRADRVLIVPDGPLHLIPFAALLDPSSQSPRYLAEIKPVHVAASVTVFAEIKKSRQAQRLVRLLAFADPDYSAVRDGAPVTPPELRSARMRGMELGPLPAARREAAAIKALYKDAARVYVGSEATEERAKALAREASLVHFACHGLADETSPLDSGLALSLPGRWQPGHDNGLLQAWEIIEQVRLDAELVTLSACSSGLGRTMSGEGMLGLTRAFQYAGARSVLASLWQVSDDSTAELMRRFYRHLAQGRSKDVALQRAQTEMIRNPATAQPYHWAAFQLSGDWR